MSAGEKALRARSFRKKAALADVCELLALAAALLLVFFYRASAPLPLGLFFALGTAFALSLAGMLAGEILAFRRCPFCGKRFSGLNWTLRPFLWRSFRCSGCDFEPYWDQRQNG